MSKKLQEIQEKNLEKMIATLLMRKKIVKTPFTDNIQTKLKSKKKVKPKLENRD
jgi:hypothetical protein